MCFPRVGRQMRARDPLASGVGLSRLEWRQPYRRSRVGILGREVTAEVGSQCRKQEQDSPEPEFAPVRVKPLLLRVGAGAVPTCADGESRQTERERQVRIGRSTIDSRTDLQM